VDRRAWVRRHAETLAFAAGLVAVLAPLVTTRVLPFHDASGLIGLCGALAHAGDPATRVHDFFSFDLGPYPSVLYFGWGWLAGKVGVPMDVAFSVFTGLFCLAGPLLALRSLLHAFGRPTALALLALPFVYHHQIWFGFLGSAAALTGMLYALAYAKRVVDRPTPGAHAGLAVALLFVATAHPFPFALTLGLVAPVLVWPPRQPTWGARLRRLGARALAFVPALLFLSPWAAGFFGGRPGTGGSLWGRVRRQLRPHVPGTEDLSLFLRWLGDGYATWVDELVPAAGLLLLAVGLVVGVRPAGKTAPAGEDREDGEAAPRPGWPWLLWAIALLAIGYLVLPMQLVWPDFWWGVRVRLVIPLLLVAIVAVRPRRRGLPAAALAGPAAIVGAAFAVVVAVDFAGHFRGRVLDGFDEAIAALPPGQSVLGMPVNPDAHYTEAHPYLVQHYVARTGGTAVPALQGHARSYWVTPHPPPPHPGWGNPRHFVWEEHAAGFDYFLLQVPVRGPAPDPFADAPPGAVEPVVTRGRWRLYRNRERLTDRRDR
jgi:hypothetical protein